MISGTEFSEAIKNLNGAARENLAAAYIYTLNTPSWMQKENWRTISIKDGSHTLTIRVSPDVVAIGTDSDYMRIPLWPKTAQQIADFYGARLISKKISDIIYRAATVKLPPSPHPPDAFMETSQAFTDHNTLINKQLKDRKSSPNESLIAGHKKDVVVGPQLDGSRVAIYGWHKGDGDVWQPYSTIHHSEYGDYSHGIRLVDSMVTLDGADTTLDAVMASTNPSIWGLVSDQGPFSPVFPNKTSNKSGGSGGSIYRPVASMSEVGSNVSAMGPALIAVGLVFGTLLISGQRTNKR